MADRHVICANRRRHALLLTTAVVFAAIGVWILFDVGLRVYRRLTGAPVTIAINHLDR